MVPKIKNCILPEKKICILAKNGLNPFINTYTTLSLIQKCKKSILKCYSLSFLVFLKV